VFVIQNASMIRDYDIITGTFAVRLDIYNAANNRAGYAEARVSRAHSGHIDDIHDLLYDMTKRLMQEMNVQLEYQVIHSLRDWVAPAAGVPGPVQQQPLGAPGASPPPGVVVPPGATLPPGAPPPPGAAVPTGASPPAGALIPPGQSPPLLGSPPPTGGLPPPTPLVPPVPLRQ
jgi:hypothetical protein